MRTNKQGMGSRRIGYNRRQQVPIWMRYDALPEDRLRALLGSISTCDPDGDITQRTMLYARAFCIAHLCSQLDPALHYSGHPADSEMSTREALESLESLREHARATISPVLLWAAARFAQLIQERSGIINPIVPRQRRA